MENKVEEIMKNYKEELDKIDKKYEVEEVEKPKKISTEQIDSKIQYEEELIKKLSFEGEEQNKDMIDGAKTRLENALKDKEKIEEKNKAAIEKFEKESAEREEKVLEMAKLKNSTVKLDSGREVTMQEKDKLDKELLKSETIKKLTQENMKISKALQNTQDYLNEKIQAKQNELDEKREQWDNFQFEYEKDENGKLTDNVTNSGDFKKITEEYEEIRKELNQLKSLKIEDVEKDLLEMQEKCNQYLQELKAPTKEQKAFEQAWNSAKKDEDEIEENKVTNQPTRQNNVNGQEIKINNQTNLVKNKNEVKISAKDDCVYINGNKINNLGIAQAMYNKTALFKKIGIDDEIRGVIGKSSFLKKVFVDPFIIASIKSKLDPVFISMIDRQDEKAEGTEKIGEKIGVTITDYIESVYKKTELPIKLFYDLKETSLTESTNRLIQKYARHAQKIPGVEVEGLEKRENFFVRLLKGTKTAGLLEETNPINQEAQMELKDNFRKSQKINITPEQKKAIEKHISEKQSEKRKEQEER